MTTLREREQGRPTPALAAAFRIPIRWVLSISGRSLGGLELPLVGEAKDH
jgi:hypothetical protein